MIKDNNLRYSLDDVTIVPEIVSSISSRSMCNTTYSDGYLPLFTAPMSAVVDEENVEVWKRNKIHPIIPRNVSYNKRVALSRKGEWVAWGLNEFKNLFINNETPIMPYNYDGTTYALIDVANGHMDILIQYIKKSKDIASRLGIELVIMVGNIANAETYRTLSLAGADYIRVSIGSGQTCLTAVQTGVHYPIASLLDEINKIKHELLLDENMRPAKVVADGGMRCFSDIIKSLALGADYVMCGSLFAGFIESAALFNCDNTLSATRDRELKPMDIDDRHNNLTNAQTLKGFMSFMKSSSPEPWVVETTQFEEMLNLVKEIESEDKRKYSYTITYTQPDYRECRTWDRNKCTDIQYTKLYICIDSNFRLNPKGSEWILKNKQYLTKQIFGMSTRQAQELIGDGKTQKTSEGTEKTVKVTTNARQWTENFQDYLRSAMSYTNARTIEDFVADTTLVLMSNNSLLNYKK